MIRPEPRDLERIRSPCSNGGQNLVFRQDLREYARFGRVGREDPSRLKRAPRTAPSSIGVVPRSAPRRLPSNRALRRPSRRL